MARPKLQLDETQIEKLASIHCSLEEIAAVMKCSTEVLKRRYLPIIEMGRSVGKSSLKRKQWEVAMKGNVSMLIWLSKIYLGQRDPSFDYNIAKKETEGMNEKQLIHLAKREIAKLEPEKAG